MINAKTLIEKYKEGKCTDDEIRLLHSWFHEMNIDEKTSLDEHDLKLENSNLKFFTPTLSMDSNYGIRIVAAAALFAVICSLVYFIGFRIEKEISEEFFPTNAIVLQLEDGRQINLNEVKDGLIKDVKGISINKTASGRIQYKFQPKDYTLSKALEYHTVKTPIGEVFEIVLADGTSVTLNAHSSLRFPANFEGSNFREVELMGEAYFDVSKSINKTGNRRSFIVKSKNQKVEVLGTAFNIQAYTNEPITKTTLVNGKIRVYLDTDNKNGMLIENAGEQVLTHNGNLKRGKVSLENEIAWKMNKYVFHNQDIYSIMRALARDYSIEVDYKNDFKGDLFGGIISKDKSLEDILKLLEDTGEVKFQIFSGRRNLQERRIVVMK